MALPKKYRRNLVHEGKAYVWWVKEVNDNYAASTLHVISQAKDLTACYVLGQTKERCTIEVSGSAFVQSDPKSAWRYFECPRFDPHSIITPKRVVELLKWCLAPIEPRIQTPPNWQCGGNPPDVVAYKLMNKPVSSEANQDL